MPLDITMIGGGMIAHDQILPSIYHLQRLNVVGKITIAARHSKMLRELAEAPRFRDHFPGHAFEAHPALTDDPHKSYPDMYKRVIERMPKGQLVVVATPETTHHEIIRIKEEWTPRPEYGRTVNGTLIYEAVLDGGVRTVPEFAEWLERVGSA